MKIKFDGQGKLDLYALTLNAEEINQIQLCIGTKIVRLHSEMSQLGTSASRAGLLKRMFALQDLRAKIVVQIDKQL